MISSAPTDVRIRSVIIVAVPAITLLLLSLASTVNNNNNNILILQPVFAQQQNETGFLTYENPTHGIFMQYPSNWLESTSGLTDYTNLVAFYSPLQNLSDTLPARLIISVINYGQNISLPEYTDSVLTAVNQSQQVDVRNSSDVTIAGYPGHRLVFAVQPFQNSTFILDQMNTWTTIGDKVYMLRYEGEESKFNQHLPEVSQMLESLEITNMANTTKQ
jgi:hypothetical protein